MGQFSCTLNNETDTVAFGKRLAEALPVAAVVALNGTLGAGKTRLVRAFAEACGVSAADITSPTFTLWQTYRGTRLIHHLDAYRLRDEDEFLELGVEEAFDEQAVTFIEWADRVRTALPPDHLTLTMHVVSESVRTISMQADSPIMEAVLDKLR